MTAAKAAPTAEDVRVTKATKVLVGVGASVLSAAILGIFVFLLNMRDSMTQIKTRDEMKNERLQSLDKNVETIKSDVQGLKNNDIQQIKDRMTKLEVELKKENGNK